MRSRVAGILSFGYWVHVPKTEPKVHRAEGGFTASDTVGLVVEYAPATGETRVRFPDGVEPLHMKRPLFGLSRTRHSSGSAWIV